MDFAHHKPMRRVPCFFMRHHQTPIEHGHLMDVLYACTDESHIALQVLRLNEELDLNTVVKMYAMALEVSRGKLRSFVFVLRLFSVPPKFDGGSTIRGHLTRCMGSILGPTLL